MPAERGFAATASSPGRQCPADITSWHQLYSLRVKSGDPSRIMPNVPSDRHCYQSACCPGTPEFEACIRLRGALFHVKPGAWQLTLEGLRGGGRHRWNGKEGARMRHQTCGTAPSITLGKNVGEATVQPAVTAP